MAEDHIYANLNSYPIILKTQRRISKTVNPREVVRGSWWSRYVGPRQLSKIDDPRDLMPEEPRHLFANKCPSCESSCQGGCEVNLQGLQDFKHYKLVAGTYFCKYCSEFAEVKKIIENHIKEKHSDELIVEKDNIEEDLDDKSISGEEIIISFKPEQKIIKEETTYYWVLNSGDYRCKECGKDCKSKAGLVKHVNSRHRGGE